MGSAKNPKVKNGGSGEAKEPVVKHPTRILKKKLVLNALQKGGKEGKSLSVGKAMRDAGFSDKYADNPQRMTRSKEWRDLMDEFLPDSLLAETHHSLLTAGEIQHYVFPAVIKVKSVRMSDKNAENSTIKAKEAEAGSLPDDEIQAIVESVPGCKLIYIRYEQFLGGKVAYYQAPDSKSRKDALDMAYKLRGKYAAEKIDVRGKYSELSNKELAERIAKLKAYLQKKPVKK